MADFEQLFPEVANDNEKIEKLNEDEMKSTVGKQKWRDFIAKYEKKGALAGDRRTHTQWRISTSAR